MAGLALLCGLLPARAPAATQLEPLLGAGVESRFDSEMQGGSELMNKLEPELGLRLFEERLSLESLYSPDLVHHLVAGNLSLDHRAQLDLKGQPGRRLTLEAKARFYRVEDTSTLPRFGLAKVPGGALWLHGDLVLRYLLTRRTDLTVGYLHDTSKLYAGGYPLGVVHEPSLGLAHALTRRLKLGGEARAQLFANGLRPTGEAFGADLTLRYQLARHALASAKAGGELWTARGERALVPHYRVELAYEGRRLGLAAAAEHALVGAAGFAEAVRADAYQLFATWRALADLTWEAGGGFYRNRGVPHGPISAQGFAVGAGFDWRLGRGVHFHAGYDYIGQTEVGGTSLTMARHLARARLGYRNFGR